MSPLAEPIISPDEYLRRERAADQKSEFVNGRIYAMAGASRAHNRIVFNLAREVGVQLRGRPCEAYVNDMRVKVNQTGLYTYPDMVGLCEEPHFEDGHDDTLLNPVVIVEVLSDSTEKNDRGIKFSHYRRLESLREYILIAQSQPSVERYVRKNELWTLVEEVSRLDGAVTMESLACTLSLSAIYEQVEFPSDDRRL